jgi:site-specific recombinase XerD
LTLFENEGVGCVEKTPREWIEEFLISREAQGLSRSTLDLDRWVLERLGGWMLRRGRSLAQLTPSRLGAFVDRLRRRCSGAGEVSTSTINTRLRTLRQWFRYLIHHDLLLINPIAGFREKSTRILMGRGAFRLDEIQRIFDVLERQDPGWVRDRAIVAVLYGAGLRLGEALGLGLTDYDPEGFLLIREGKGRRDRMVPLGPVACTDLDRYLEKGRPALVTKRSGGAIFLNQRGTRLGWTGFDMRLHQIEKAARIKPFRSSHAFRHSFATHLLKEGATVRHIQEILGHQRLETTALYTHVDIEQLRLLIERHHPRQQDPQ